MKTIHAILLLFSVNVGYAQSDECDYKLLNDALPTLVGKNNMNEIPIYSKSIMFEEQQEFFTSETFEAYTYRVLGVDGNRVKKLIKTLDFAYLRNTIRDEGVWDFKQIKHNVISAKPYDRYDSNPKTQYAIAKPLYTKDRQMAFLFYAEGGGLSSATTVKVYKKIKGRWLLYLQIPRTMS